MKKIVWLSVFILPLLGYTQTDSSRYSGLHRIKIDQNFSLLDSVSNFDTTINEFHSYFPAGLNNTVSLGNVYLLNAPILFTLPEFAFSLGEHLDYVSDTDVNYSFTSRIPFARASYISGPKKTQLFDVFFTQNLSKKSNIAIEFKTFGSNGFYLNQEVTGNKFSIQNNFRTKGDRYGIYWRFMVRTGVLHENGGIKGDSIYLESIKTNKLGVQVWLEDGKNQYDLRESVVSQYFRITKRDSTFTGDGSFITMDNSSEYRDVWFSDPEVSKEYLNQFGLGITDSVMQVYDKSKFIGYNNRVGYLFKKHFSSPILGFKSVKFGGGFHYNLFDYSTVFNVDQFDQTLFDITLHELANSFMVLRGKYAKGFSGFNDSGYKFNVGGRILVPNIGAYVDGEYTSSSSSPEYKQIRYSNNVISWDNSFENIVWNEVRGEIGFKKLGFNLSARTYHVSNFVFYGANLTPMQYSEAFGGVEFNATENFILGPLHCEVGITYQSVSEGAPVNLPSILLKGKLYYQRFLFKDAMELRFGVDYWQSSGYTANSYIPFTRSFVLQNDYQVGDYPFIDFYTSIRIRTAQAFVKFQNISQLVLDKSYMMVPYYPMPDFGISFGIRWDFFN